MTTCVPTGPRSARLACVNTRPSRVVPLRASRRTALSCLLATSALAACDRPALPPQAPAPTTLVSDPPSTPSPNARPPVAADGENGVAPCKTPCQVTDATVDVLASDVGIVFTRTFGRQGGVQLLERRVGSAADTELAANVLPAGTKHVYRVRGDSRTLLLATDGGLATWDPAKRASTMLAREPQGVFNALIDGDTIVYVGGDCALKQVPRAGGPVRVLAKAQGTYCALPLLAMDPSDVYFTLGRTLYAVPRAGGAVRRVSTDSTRSLVGLVVDGQVGDEHATSPLGDSVYVLMTPPQPQRVGTSQQGQVVRVSKRGGASTVLTQTGETGNAYTLAADAKRLYWVESSAHGTHVAMLPKAGGTSVGLADVEGSPYGIAVAPHSVYFVRWVMNGRPSSRPEVLRLDKPLD